MPRAAVPKGGNDNVYTPDPLAQAIVDHYAPTGSVVDPCSGGGAFVRAFVAYDWAHPGRLSKLEGFDLATGHDFLQIPDGIRWDWIITNPPWSLFTPFLHKAMATARNVVFLDKLNAWSLNGRLNSMAAAGYEFREKARVAQPPPPWPQMGFAFAAVHIGPATTPGQLGRPLYSRIPWTPTK